MSASNPIPMGVDALMAAARAQAGVDLFDEEAVEPLGVLLKSLNEEGGLHEAGALAHQNKLIRLLRNRLQMKRDFAAHPEIAEIRIERPLFIIGFARSGTTKTQKTLAATGDFNFLPFWRGFNPSSVTGAPGEDVGARIKEADDYCRWFDQKSPDTKKGHAFETHEPEEDTTLTETCLVAPSFIGFAEVQSYLEWLATQPPTILFEQLRDVMKYQVWQGLADPNKRWLLKAPTYYGLEGAILSVFPDADFVMTHRSPLATVPSSCKLVSLFRIPFSTAPVATESLLRGFSTMMGMHIANRTNLRDLRILDVHFDEVTAAMPEVVRRIYQHIGMPAVSDALERVAAWDAGNPKHKHGAFTYSLEEFGLDKARIEADNAPYLDMMKSIFGAAAH